MPISADVSSQMKDALRARESERLMALRNIRAALLVEMKKDNSTSLPDEASIVVLRRLEKQRRESIEAYDQAGRDEQAALERSELELIRSFLPELAGEAQTRSWVEAAIAETGASSPRDLGRVMGAVMKAHRDVVDGNLARKLASDLL